MCRTHALREYLARSGSAQPSADAIDEVLLSEPFDDPDPDTALSVDVDHSLYGAPGGLDGVDEGVEGGPLASFTATEEITI